MADCTNFAEHAHNPSISAILNAEGFAFIVEVFGWSILNCSLSVIIDPLTTEAFCSDCANASPPSKIAMRTVLLLFVAGALSACLLPLDHGQSGKNGQCIPNSVVSADLRATVYRTGSDSTRVPDEFRAELLNLTLVNFELEEECSLLSRGGLQCERKC